MHIKRKKKITTVQYYKPQNMVRDGLAENHAEVTCAVQINAK